MFLAVLNTPMDPRHFQRGWKHITLPGSRATPKDNLNKERLRQFPWELKMVGPQIQMKFNPLFCLAMFWGSLTWQWPSQGVRTQNETYKKAIVVPGRERINNHWVWKRRDKEKFYLLLSSGYCRQRSKRADSGKNSYPSSASASFSRIPSADAELGFKVKSVAPISKNLARFSINFNISFHLVV